MFTAAGFTGPALDIALGVAWIEGDGPAATKAYGYPAVYSDAVGDLDKMDAKWGPSVSHFQVRALRNPAIWGPLDRVRVAELLRNPVYATKAAFLISKDGVDFTPWSAFKSNAYLPHVGKDYQLVTGHPHAGEWSK
jgi:hypothetical protein